MENKKDIYMEIYNKMIPEETEKHYINLIYHLYNLFYNYNNYKIIYERKEYFNNLLKVKNDELDRYNKALIDIENGMDLDISGLILNADENKMESSFDFWFKVNDKSRYKISKLERKIENLNSDIEQIKNQLKELKKVDVSFDFFALKKNIDEEFKNKLSYNSDLPIGDLAQIKSLMENKNDKIKLHDYFVISVRLKNIIFEYIDELAKSFTFSNNSDYYAEGLSKIKIMMLCLIGMIREEISLDIMVNNPFLENKVQLLKLVYNFLKNDDIDYNKLDVFDNVKIVNSNNQWFLELVDLMKDYSGNNKIVNRKYNR